MVTISDSVKHTICQNCIQPVNSYLPKCEHCIQPASIIQNASIALGGARTRYLPPNWHFTIVCIRCLLRRSSLRSLSQRPVRLTVKLLCDVVAYAWSVLMETRAACATLTFPALDATDYKFSTVGAVASARSSLHGERRAPRGLNGLDPRSPSIRFGKLLSYGLTPTSRYGEWR